MSDASGEEGEDAEPRSSGRPPCRVIKARDKNWQLSHRRAVNYRAIGSFIRDGSNGRSAVGTHFILACPRIFRVHLIFQGIFWIEYARDC